MSKYPATCKWSKDGYLLLKGSKISSAISPSCRDWIKKAREENADKINTDYILTDDIMFKSSTAAATFISASSLNGKICWKDANGMLLKDLIEKGE